MTKTRPEDTDALISAVWALVTALMERGYTNAQIKKALSPNMIDACFAIETKRQLNSRG